MAGDVVFASSSTGGVAGGVSFGDEDILAFDVQTNTWSMHFDGSDVGLGGADVDAFHLLDNDDLLLSFNDAESVPGLGTVQDEDVVQFTPTSLGTNTAGAFQLFFDGSDVGLTTGGEDVDAVGFAPDGRLVLSTLGSYSVPGGLSGDDEDLIAFNDVTLGSNTAGTWELFFDGSDVGLTTADEDVWGVWIDGTTSEIFLTTKDVFSAGNGFAGGGISGDGADVFMFDATTLGADTSGDFSDYFDGSANGLGGERVDGIFIQRDVAPPPAEADLAVAKTDGVTSVAPGGQLTYTVTVANNGPLPVGNTTVTDSFPPELTGVTWNASQTGGATGFDGSGSGNINDSGISLPVGAEITYTVIATVDPGTPAGATLVNTATVADSVVNDPFPDNNSATDDDTVVATAAGPGELIYVSSTSGGAADGVAFRDEDILVYNTATDTWAMHFDGSDVGLSPADVDALLVLDNDDILLSFNNAAFVLGVGTVQDEDIVRFTPTSLGTNTAGAFELFFDGSDVGLANWREDVDAIGFAPDGRLVLSTIDSYSLPGGLSGNDEDLLVFNDVSFGPSTAGTWELFFDGSDVGLTTSAEDLWGIWLDPNSDDVFLTTKGDFSVPGLSGVQEDIFIFNGTTGASTGGTFRKFWHGADDGFADERLDGISIEFLNAPPVFTSSPDQTAPENQTAVATVTATDPDFDPVTFSKTGGGADEAFFSITVGGVLTFNSAPDFENPLDAGADNVYEVEVQAADGNGGITTQLVLVTVTDVNEAPVITSDGGGATASVSTAENTTGVTDVQSSDPEGETENGGGLTYSLTTVAGGGVDNGFFTLNTLTGLLTFTSATDFENPLDGDTDNDYEVQVTVTDSGGLTDVQDITVTVTNVNEVPVITSDGGGATASVNVAENTTGVTDVQSTDPDGETESGGGLTYSFTTVAGGGVDNGFFTLNTATGLLTFSNAPDFETPLDNDTDNDYEAQITVTDSGGLTDVQDITVTVTNVNDPPVITSDGGGATASVNTAEDTTGVTDVQSSDPEGETENGGGLTHSFTTVAGGGVDNGFFTLNALTGLLTFTSAPDFENPLDSDTDNDYEVQVTVTDSGGLTDVQDIAVTVTNVNEVPVITSDGGGATASVNVAENTTGVTDVQSTDPDGETENGGGLTYSFTTVAGGGVDNGFFTLNTLTGLLTFTNAPDFETPLDNDTDNDYEAQITVTDAGGLTDVQDITVTVTNVNEAPVITSDGGGATASVNTAENTTGVTDVQSTDPEGETENGGGLTYSLTTVAGGGVDNGFFTLNTLTGLLTFTSAPDFENPLDSDTDNDYEVQVTVTDSGGLTDVQDITVTVTDVVVENLPPAITSNSGGATASVNVAENTSLVTDVQTSDDSDSEGSGLTYTFTTVAGGGVDNTAFFITPTTGVLSFTGGPPDFETPLDFDTDNDYEVQVTVTDSGGLTDFQDITVTVTDVNEAPTINPDSYTTVGNVQLNVGGAAPSTPHITATPLQPLANDSDVDSVLTAGAITTPATKGTVSQNANGTFTYQPNAGATGADSFTFTVLEDGVDNGASETVNITIGGMIWFIDKGAAGANSGTSSNPFNGMGSVAGTSAGDTLYVDDGTYTAGITLLNNQTLHGEGLAFSATDPNDGTQSLSISAGARPILTTTNATAIGLGSGNTIRGLNVGSTGTGFGIADSGAAGSLTISDVAISGTGGAIQVDNGGTLGITLDSITSTSSSAQGIDLSGVGGTFTVSGNTSISGAAAGIDITNSTGSASFTFADTSVSSSGTGVNLASSASASFSFADLDVTTTNSTGLFASSAGTVNSTSGTIGTGSGRGVDIDNANLGIILTSVTSVGGSAPGIDLASTTGSFTVTGDGATAGPGPLDDNNGSGGTISNKTGNVDGVLLNNVTNVSLNYMNIDNNSRNGIFGQNVNGFVITRSNLRGNTDSANPNENALNFDNLFGTVAAGSNPTAFSNLLVTNSTEHNVEIVNTSGTLAKLLVSDSKFSNDGTSGLASNNFNFLAQGSADMTLDVQSSEFIGNRGTGALTASGIFADGQSTADLDVTIEGSLFEDNNNAINVSHSGSGTVTFDISDNGTAARPIVGNLSAAEAAGAGGASTAINVVMSEPFTGTASGVINSNLIGKSGVTESGSATGRGILADMDGTGSLMVEIDGNTVRETDSNGIRTWLQNPTINGDGGSMNVKVTSNTIDAVSSIGIYVRIRDETDQTMIAKIEGNTVTNTTSTHVRYRNNAPGTASLEVGSANLGDTSLQVLTTNNPGAGSWETVDPISVVANGTAGFPLHAATGPGARDELEPLSYASLLATVEAARDKWLSTDLTGTQESRLSRVSFEIVDLPGGQLAGTFASTVSIDVDAAGHGWFADATPMDDAEFETRTADSERVASDSSEASGRMDLLSVVMHELGHVLGIGHSEDRHSLMSDELPTGTRRLPEAGAARDHEDMHLDASSPRLPPQVVDFLLAASRDESADDEDPQADSLLLDDELLLGLLQPV